MLVVSEVSIALVEMGSMFCVSVVSNVRCVPRFQTVCIYMISALFRLGTLFIHSFFIFG